MSKHRFSTGLTEISSRKVFHDGCAKRDIFSQQILNKNRLCLAHCALNRSFTVSQNISLPPLLQLINPASPCPFVIFSWCGFRAFCPRQLWNRVLPKDHSTNQSVKEFQQQNSLHTCHNIETLHICFFAEYLVLNSHDTEDHTQ